MCEIGQYNRKGAYSTPCSHYIFEFNNRSIVVMKKIHDLTGQRFGRLVVIERVDSHIQPSGQRKTRWLCKCDCGNEKIVSSSQLKSGMTKSCGCLSREKSKERLFVHGLKHTRLYVVWCDIKSRCFNPNNTYYKDYGGRDITICSEWKDNFMVFYEWAYANGYNENALKGECTIDRIDNNKGYCPDNCRWVSMKEQCKNRRSNIFLTYKDKTHCLVDWVEIIGIKYDVLYRRLKRGWSVEKAFTTPVKKEII